MWSTSWNCYAGAMLHLHSESLTWTQSKTVAAFDFSVGLKSEN